MDSPRFVPGNNASKADGLTARLSFILGALGEAHTTLDQIEDRFATQPRPLSGTAVPDVQTTINTQIDRMEQMAKGLRDRLAEFHVRL